MVLFRGKTAFTISSLYIVTMVLLSATYNVSNPGHISRELSDNIAPAIFSQCILLLFFFSCLINIAMACVVLLYGKPSSIFNALSS